MATGNLSNLPSEPQKENQSNLAYKWNIPFEKILVAGDSGNDKEMLKGDLLGVVVANYSSELEELKGLRRIYFQIKSMQQE